MFMDVGSLINFVIGFLFAGAGIFVFLDRWVETEMRWVAFAICEFVAISFAASGIMQLKGAL